MLVPLHKACSTRDLDQLLGGVLITHAIGRSKSDTTSRINVVIIKYSLLGLLAFMAYLEST